MSPTAIKLLVEFGVPILVKVLEERKDYAAASELNHLVASHEEIVEYIDDMPSDAKESIVKGVSSVLGDVIKGLFKGKS